MQCAAGEARAMLGNFVMAALIFIELASVAVFAAVLP